MALNAFGGGSSVHDGQAPTDINELKINLENLSEYGDILIDLNDMFKQIDELYLKDNMSQNKNELFSAEGSRETKQTTKEKKFDARFKESEIAAYQNALKIDPLPEYIYYAIIKIKLNFLQKAGGRNYQKLKSDLRILLDSYRQEFVDPNSLRYSDKKQRFKILSADEYPFNITENKRIVYSQKRCSCYHNYVTM